MSLHEVLDMVGQAFDEKWIDVETALELIVEHGHVTRERALGLLCGSEAVPVDPDDWTPLREWRDDGSWS